MSNWNSVLTPVRRDLLLVALAFIVLAGPLWVSLFAVGESAQKYDRLEVTTNESTIHLEDAPVSFHSSISDEIICATGDRAYRDRRHCAFERYLSQEETVIRTDSSSTSPGTSSLRSAARYDYAQIDGTLYELQRYANESVPVDHDNQDLYGEMYRIELKLEPIDPDTVLQRVSVDIDAVPSTIADAATDGSATSRSDVDVPHAPVRLDDGTYYRVYRTNEVLDPAWYEPGTAWLGTYLAPIAGLWALVSLRYRFRVEISHSSNK